MGHRDFSVASASALRGSVLLAKRESPHASRASVTSIGFAHSPPQARVAREEAGVPLLKPTVYSPPQDSTNLALPGTMSGGCSVVGGHSRRKHDIYFTPVDVTRSQTSLSSPISSPPGSPRSPHSPRSPPPPRSPDDDGDGCATPRASRPVVSRPPSQMFVGDGSTLPPRENAVPITPEQLDQLIVALARSRMVQKHVRGDWWDVDDVPDDDGIVSSFSHVSLPTLTSASRLYSQPHDHVATDRPNVRSRREAPAVTLPWGGGVALCDSKLHGTPVRFLSKDYRHAGRMLNVGTCTHLTIPCGAEVESTLRVEAPRTVGAGGGRARVVVQCQTEVVDRKTGKRVYSLMADEDVTDAFAHAAWAELAAVAGDSARDLLPARVGGHPDTPTEASSSPDGIDWVALADELHAAAAVTDLVDDTAALLAHLAPPRASAATRALLATLARIKADREDVLILQPTAFHPHGTPSSMRVPWVSRRLHADWYASPAGPGHTAPAHLFQAAIVSHVAKHHHRRALAPQPFACEASWGPERLRLDCVPLMGRAERTGEAWACFVRGG